MKTKSLVLLAMAMGCGLVAMLGVQQILSGEKKPKEDMVPVLVAKQEIAPGVRLDPTQVAFEDRPRESVPQGAVTDVEQYDDRSLKVRAYPGELILQAKLGNKGEHGPSNSIPEGLRVVTVPVNMTTVHSGMIRPGDRVDVLVTYSIRRPGVPEVSRTKTVLEYIEVFAIDRVREGEEGSDSGKGAKAENLSVLVTPEQAHVLMLAANKGRLQMALRNVADKDQAKVAAIDDKIFDDLKATKGADDDDGDKVAEAKPAETQDKKAEPTDFKKFLQTVEPAAPAVVEPTEDVWAIEIFEGETRRVEQIKLPVKGGAATTEPAKVPEPPEPQEVHKVTPA